MIFFKLNKRGQKFVKSTKSVIIEENIPPMLSSTPSQLPFNKTIDKTPRKILSPIQGSALEPLLDLTTESEHFESADEGEIIGDEHFHPVTSEFVNQNKTGEKVNMKTEFIPEISNSSISLFQS